MNVLHPWRSGAPCIIDISMELHVTLKKHKNIEASWNILFWDSYKGV